MFVSQRSRTVIDGGRRSCVISPVFSQHSTPYHMQYAIIVIYFIDMKVVWYHMSMK